MASGLPGTSLLERGSLREQPTSSVPKDVPGGRSAKEDESSALVWMRDRIKEVEQLLKVVRGTSAVFKSKAEKAAEREKFLLDEITRASEQLLCKESQSPRVFVFCLFLVLKFLRVCTGTRIDPREDAQCVRNRLNTLCDVASRVAPSFWSDRSKGYVLGLLQDRVEQVSEFIESCRSALALVHDVLFPLNPAPQGLAALMRMFCHDEAVYDYVQEQLIAGAKAAMAFVRVHHPGIDLKVIGRGPPPAPVAGPRRWSLIMRLPQRQPRVSFSLSKPRLITSFSAEEISSISWCCPSCRL